MKSDAIELQQDAPAMFTRRAFRWLLVVLLALLPLACRSKSESRVYPVRGKVFYQGKPASGAIVFFFPAGTGPAKVMPHAVVEDNGSFQLTTYKVNDGAPPGMYGVTVSWTKPGHGDNDGETLIPIEYGDPQSSGLQAEVKEQPNELPPFELQRGGYGEDRRGTRR
ncbi:MAG TPA: hypothetical protein VKS79_10150 [Gemmataceae bacterium]|nr:hypothetical protein [Gemmataceae bacterium]